MLNLLLIVTSVLLNAGAQLFLKKAMLAIGSVSLDVSAVAAMLPKVVLNLWFWGGMACYAVSILIWLVVLSRVEVSYAYPFLSIGYIVAALAGYFFLGESVSVCKAGGIALICAGVVLLYRA